MKKIVINSPFRWAGSKKKLLNEMLETMFVRNKNNYIEPFLGSGIVLLNVINNSEELGYKKYYVNDINKNIIEFYKLLKTDVTYILNIIEEVAAKYNDLDIDEQKEMYYRIREEFNNSENNKCINFYFLMKTGFNGVYRVNSSGKFNVPFGKKTKIFVDRNLFLKLSQLIQNVEFYNLPYQEFMEIMKANKIINNSFIYCDPPYIPDDESVYQKQMLYTKSEFNHQELFNFFVDKNISDVMISMSESKIADSIYMKKPFEKKVIKDILRVVNPKKLFSSKEIAYINYKIEK